jgi:hypothetical protein
MPDYFAGYEIVARTKNFLVTCEDDAGARVRAQNIGYTCEADLARLNDLFSTNFEAGKSSPHSIWVVVLKDDSTSTANGWNYGYETEESSQIWIRRGFVPPPPPPPSLVPQDPAPLPGPNLNTAIMEFPRFVFVAELAEILMDFTGYGWDFRQSPGEGLSNLLGALLHPAGYYDTGQGPRINQWLNGGGGPPAVPPRADFVSKTKNTDQDIFSYGCAILFINYLVDQLGHPLKDVIRVGGSTLAETYARVTGQPASAAYGAFNGLLQAHIGATTTNNMLRDNIFPLLDVKYRSIQTTVPDPIDKGHMTDAGLVLWDVKPGIMCPVAGYAFYRHHEQVEQPVFARARGMANAAFRWMIEGVEMSVHGQWTNAAVVTPFTVKNPDETKTNVGNAVTFQYGIVDVWNGSVLYLKTVSWNGNCELKVTVAAKEAVANEAEVTAEESVGLTTVTWVPGEEIKKAWKRCNPFFARVNDTFWYLTEKLSDAKNRPDPPSERGVREIVHAVEQVQKAVARYAKAGHQAEAEVWRQLGTSSGLRSADPVPAAVDMTRLRLRDAGPGQGPRDDGKKGPKSSA